MDDRKLINANTGVDLEEEMGPIGDFIKSLKAIKAKLESEGWTNLSLNVYHFWDSCEVQLLGDRPETDEEYNKRKKAEQAKAKRREKKLEKERATYERLKEKFGE